MIAAFSDRQRIRRIKIGSGYIRILKADHAVFRLIFNFFAVESDVVLDRIKLLLIGDLGGIVSLFVVIFNPFGKSLSDILSRSIMVDNETYDNILEARIHKYE